MLLSIIVPLGPADNSWLQLFNDLKKHHRLINAQGDYEILLANNRGNQSTPDVSGFSPLPIQLLTTHNGRAKSMNDAAQQAQGEYLWFVHADTRVDEHAITSLLNALKKQPQSLLYFDLVFTELRHMSINAKGLKWRSRWLKCPFGDQAFCISHKGFNSAGCYREDLSSGEDHYFVWQARSQGIVLQALNSAISTSARKYQKNGWLYTTTSHIYYFIKQALAAFYQYKIKPILTVKA